MSDLRQRLAASALLVKCEHIAASGRLPEPDELSLRVLIAEVRSSFGAGVPERSNVVSIGDHDPEYRRTVETVAREMGT